MSRDIDSIRHRCIGTVESVTPKEIRIVLDTQAPQSTALNTGTPTQFPKVNSYVLIPNEVGSLVGIVHFVGSEPSNFPKRKGFRDFGLIDLPFPLRKMRITPVGTLKCEQVDSTTIVRKLDRGVYNFPSVGDAVVIPDYKEEQAILQDSDSKATVHIGHAAQNSAFPIK